MRRRFVLLICLAVLLDMALTSVVGAEIVGWWKLDETTGTVAADSSDYGNHGTCEGDVVWVDGMVGGAWEGDGSGDYIRVPHSDSLSFTDAVTVTMWLFGGLPPDQPICKGSDGAAWATVFAIRLDDSPSRHIDFRGRTGTATGLNSNTAIPADEWVHVAATFDIAAPGNNEKIYLNGVLDAETRVDTPIATNTDDVLIGADGYSTTRWHWQGRLDDIRIYNEALPEDDIQDVMAGKGPNAETAGDPVPEDEGTDVPRDTALAWTPGEFAVTHDVYLGSVFDDVNDASRSNPLDVLLSQGQSDAAYASDAVLSFGQTYYWRIDEVNAAPDNTIFKGDLWSFTVEPFAYAIAGVVATSNGVSDAGVGPERTVDSSGLNENDEHSTVAADMWLAVPGADPLQIQYEFDAVYKLHEMLVWNYNVQFELMLGFGLKDVTVEYSQNGADWTALGDVQLTQGTAKADYAANTAVSFGGVAAKYVRLTAGSGYGPMGQFGLSEVRFMFIPVQAREPQPTDGETEVLVGTTLSWRAGREAVSHDVYLGTDPEALAMADSVGDASYAPSDLQFGAMYYWQIVEVNEAEAIGAWEGDIWNFTTQEFVAIDDMESYDDEENRIFDTWLDGFVNNTGSTVGYFEAPFAEQTIVNSGSQSMPLEYDNSAAPFYSEAERDLGSMNLTGNGADSLRLFVSGQAPAFLETADGSILMNAIGADIWDASDEGRYAYKSLTGDGSLTARVDALDGSPNPWAKAGVMIRQSTDAGSQHAFMVLTGGDGNGYSYQRRVDGNGSSTSDNGVAPAIAPPYWVKIERAGNVFTASTSPDGTEWTELGTPQTITMDDAVLIGLAVTSHNANQATSAEFSNVSTTGDVTGDWQIAEIGVTQPAGNTPEALYVALADTSGNVAVAAHPDPYATARFAWTEWVIPYSDLAGVNLSSVAIVYVGVGDRDNPTSGGTGLLFIDDIGYGRPAAPADEVVE